MPTRHSFTMLLSWFPVLLLVGLPAALSAVEPQAPRDAAGAPDAPGQIEIGYDPQASIQVKMDAIEQEVARLQRAGAKARAEALSSHANRLRARLKGEPSETNEPEVHVAGVYEGLFPDGPRKFGRVTVEVDVVDAPVILVLCAYSPVRWDVRVGKDVKVERLILAGYGEQELVAPIEGMAAETYTYKGKSDKYFYAYNRKEDSEGGYRRAANIIRDLTGSEIRTLVGEYRAKGTLIVGPRNEDWRRQRVLAEAEPLYLEATAMSRARQRERWAGLRFHAINWTIAQRFQGTAEWGEFTPAGPIEGTLRALPQHHRGAVTVDPRGPSLYVIRGNLARIDVANNQVEQLEIEGDLPELSHPCGLAFDTKRNRVILTSKGGEGFMYSFEPDKNQWSLLRSMKNVDMYAVTYSSEDDCFYGLVVPFGGNRQGVVYQFDPTGRETKVIRPSMPIPHDHTMWHHAPAQLVSLGEYIAVLTAAADGGAMTVMMIDKKTGRTEHAGTMRPVVQARADVGEEELARLWQELRDGDAAAAAKAEQAMAGAGKGAVAFIRGQLARDAAPPDGAEVDRLVKQLDAEQVQDREKALASLREMGSLVEPHLRKARQAGLSVEAGTRVDLLLRKLTDDGEVGLETADELGAPSLRQEARAVRVLARIDTPAAVAVLRELAAGPAGLSRTRYARAALREP